VAFRLAARARRDLDTILRYILEEYGRDPAGRYELLLTTAMTEIGDQPGLNGSRPVRNRPGVSVYSISHSRLRLPRAQRARNPARQIADRLAEGCGVEIPAIVGDSDPSARAATLR
jgi:plasmid stabilization system protein ParE